MKSNTQRRTRIYTHQSTSCLFDFFIFFCNYSVFFSAGSPSFFSSVATLAGSRTAGTCVTAKVKFPCWAIIISYSFVRRRMDSTSFLFGKAIGSNSHIYNELVWCKQKELSNIKHAAYIWGIKKIPSIFASLVCHGQNLMSVVNGSSVWHVFVFDYDS